MTGEIDGDFYCAANLYKNGKCSVAKVCIPSFGCDCRRRKWPTPEQFREEYGAEYPDDGAVYELNEREWAVDRKWRATGKNYCLSDSVVVCACTPWRKPDAEWRP